MFVRNRSVEEGVKRANYERNWGAFQLWRTKVLERMMESARERDAFVRRKASRFLGFDMDRETTEGVSELDAEKIRAWMRVQSISLH